MTTSTADERHDAAHAAPAPLDVDAPDPAKIDKCVHCGFCLPTCPTYLLWGEEMDSPRGRIYLMKAVVEGRTTIDEAFVRHIDACLGCVSCVTACPSGVEYGPLIERARAQIERRYPRPPGDRLFRSALLSVIPYPARMRVMLAPLALFGGLMRRIGRALLEPAAAEGSKRGTLNQARNTAPAGGAARPAAAHRGGPDEAPGATGAGRPFAGRQQRRRIGGLLQRVASALVLAPPVTVRGLFARVPELTPAVQPERMTVALLSGCVQRLVFDEVNRATVRVLAAEGCRVSAPAAQGCCGALALHAGEIDRARALAKRNIEVFEQAGVDRVVTNAAGCGSAMKEYGELFAHDPAWASRAAAVAARVRDISELLVELGPRAPRRKLAARVVYHDACHLAHGQGVRSQPRALLEAIPGLQLLTPAESEICCGSAGIYNMVQPEPAAQLGARKVRQIAALSPEMIATGNPGCTLQIAASARGFGYNWPVYHPVQLIDASIRGVDPRRG